MFCGFFCEKFKIAAISGGTKIFCKLSQLLSRGTLLIKNFVEIALSSTVFEIQAFLCLAFLKKFENSKWSPLLANEIFVELGKASLRRYSVGQKFCRNPTSKFLSY